MAPWLWGCDRQEFGNLGFDLAHGFDQGRVGPEVAVALPLDGHFTDFATQADRAGNSWSNVLRVSTPLVVVEHLFEVVHAAEIVARTGSAPIAFDLDHVKHVRRLVGGGL